MKIAIHGKSTGPEAQQCIGELLQIVNTEDIHLAISEDYLASLHEKSFPADMATFSAQEDLSSFDFLF